MSDMVTVDIMPSEITQKTLDDQSVMEAEVITDVKAIIQYTEDRMPPPKCCIYRVPDTIRDQNPDAYTPKVVSIGPFHHDNDKLKDMKRHKQIFFKTFVQKTEANLEELVKLVIRLEPDVRASYFDEIKPGKKDFVKLILVDAVFIIELFIIVYDNMHSPKNEFGRVKKMLPPWSLDGIAKDLLLLENQLPFFVIEMLFNKARPSSQDGGQIPSFRELTYCFFESNKKIPSEIASGEIKHITDLLRLSFLSGSKISKDREKKFIKGPRDLLVYSAIELQEFGVRLKANTCPDRCLLDLKFARPKPFDYLPFRRPVLEIPEIFLEDRTEILFRNMIALEQCHDDYKTHITDYAFVLDCLINANSDVDVLTRRKIIHNFIGDPDNVANLFNGLRKNITGESISYDYYRICRDLNKYCEGQWNKRMANLKRDYCKTAWHAMATTAAIVVIILTLVQTISSLLQIALKK